MSIRKDEAQLVITIDAKESVAYQNSVSEAGKLYKAIKSNEAGTKEYNDALSATKRISDELAKTDYTKLSLKNIQDRRKQLIELQRQLPQNVFAEQGFAAELRNVNNAMRDAIDSTRGTTQQISLLDRVAEQAPGSLGVLAGSLKSVRLAILALFATPLGWILALASGVVLAVKGWYDYNTEILAAKKLTEEITGTSDALGQQIRSQAIAIAEVTGATLKETLEASKVAVNEFGVDYMTALDIIGTGIVDAGHKQDVFLESVREYSTFFGQAGFTFQEFADIVNTGIDAGIYTDKLPDAIKEFSLSITEQTKASRDALENAFGKPFTDKLLSDVTKGTVSVADALGIISKEAETVGINSQQAAQLTADLFRGAGEDAGGALQIFNLVNEALGDEPRLLTDIQKAQVKNIKLNYELQQSKAAALETDSFLAFQQFLTNSWTKIKTVWYDLIGGLVRGINFFVDNLKIDFAIVRAELNSVPTVLKIVKEGFVKTFKDIGAAGKALLDVIGNIFTLNFDAAEENFNRFKASISDAGKEFKSIGKDANAYFQGVRKEAYLTAKARIDEERRVLAEQAKLNKENTGIVTDPKAPTSRSPEKEKDKKEKIDYKKKLQERLDVSKEYAEKLLLIEEEKYLRGQITEEAFEKKKLEIKSGSLLAQMALLKALGLEETKLYHEKEVELLRLQNESAKKKAEAEKKLTEEQKKEVEKRVSNVKTDADRQLLEVQKSLNSGLISTEEAEKQRQDIIKASYDEQLRILKKAGLESTEEYLAIEGKKTEVVTNAIKERNEKLKESINTGVEVAGTLLDGISDLESQRIENEKSEKLDALDEEYARKFELAEGNAELEKKLKKEYEEEKKKIEKEAFERNKQNRIGTALDNAALAIIQSLANTTLPFPASLVAPGIIAAQTAFQVAKIRNEKFEKGGDLKLGKRFVGPKHSAGGIKLPWGDEVEGDEVMINARSSKFFSKELDYINSYKGWGRRLFNLGGSINPDVTPTSLSQVPLNAPNRPAGLDTGSMAAFAQAVDKFVAVMPRILANIKAHVVFSEIQEAQAAVNEVENAARF